MIEVPAEQRYRNAIRKARIVHERELRAFLKGDRDWLECSGDRERAFVVAAIDRAMQGQREKRI